ncbi:DUF4232 domain-containing protein [Agromyces sp. Marseille-Q5079]|uniref:DUF4232 domain-containing protein n=1 Tax=Agromyces sp. Marseille-Q5079 TaxID=3439059 RepID=UPI003D9C9154
MTPTPAADAATSGDGAEALAPETEQAPEASEPDATPAQCVDEQLALAYVARPQDSGAGQFFANLVFTNVSASDCSFDGWPGLVAEDADGAMLGGPALAEGGSSDLAVLAANGGVAIAPLHGGMPGAYGCPATTSTALRAFLSSDGAGPGVTVAQAIPVCSDRTSTLGLGPLIAG